MARSLAWIRIAAVAAVASLGATATSSGAAATQSASGNAAPNPVLVVGGFHAQQAKLDDLVSYLRSQGFHAESMQLRGSPAGTAPIAESAQGVAEKAAEMRRRKGASRVDVVGHSMGGLAQRHFIKFLGGAAHTGTYVSVGTPEQGEWLGLLCSTRYAGCRDLLPGSAFLKNLNAPPAIPPGLPAYHLFSEHEGGEKKPLPGAVNASVQSFCPGRRVEHADEPSDRAVQGLIAAALKGRPLATDCSR
ncbi:esterase/lipase family protein [Spirillospora sp. NPDC127200]